MAEIILKYRLNLDGSPMAETVEVSSLPSSHVEDINPPMTEREIALFLSKANRVRFRDERYRNVYPYECSEAGLDEDGEPWEAICYGRE